MTDLAWWQEPHHGASPPYQRSSCYVAMPDGVELALDVYLPSKAPVPTVLIQTRYFRRNHLRPRFAVLDPVLGRGAEAQQFCRHGFAVVVVDARGSGASLGFRGEEMSDDEIADGATICDWIVAQPWSDGTIAATGVSYEGTTAEHLLRNHHPAVRAVAPRFALFDIYADIIAPGGVRNRWFVPLWSRFCRAMDRNELEAFAVEIGAGPPLGLLPLLADGVAPVDDDVEGKRLAEALREHQQNCSLEQLCSGVEYRDDPCADGSLIDRLSSFPYLRELRDAEAGMYAWCGWYDGAYAEAAIKRWLAFRDTGARLVLGPWDHGSRQLPDPTDPRALPAFDSVGELVRFFRHHLHGTATGIEDEPPIHYYTVNDGAWKTAHEWPPPGFAPQPLYLAPGHGLSWEPPGEAGGADRYQVDYAATSGTGSRWHTQVNVLAAEIGWPDRAEQDRGLLVYDSEPLDKPLEVTGEPLVELHFVADATDSAFHVYLEDVLPDGSVRYVTEGVFRAVHRKLVGDPAPWERHVPAHSFRRADAAPLVPGEVAELRFHLLPISYLFHAGSRIRVAIAGADADSFVRIPASGPAPTWEVQRTAAAPSRMVLPAAWVDRSAG